MTRTVSSDTVYEPIAIVGIGCRFPGGIVSPASFWEFLMRGVDGTREVPETRWSLDRHFDPERGKPGKIYTRRGGFLDDVKRFDPQFFGISPREAAYMDPQQRLLLETTWEAFEDAGIAPTSLARHKVGVFIGLFTHDYENIHMRTTERNLHSTHSATGMSATISANRLSYAFDFMGPSLVVDTACSSSLVATHLACRALQSGEAEIAVAGGVNLQLLPEMTMALCNASMLSPDGLSKAFDARANGYARADGAGVVVLKPLPRAQQDGDAIYAVIVGSAVNQDGHSPGITVPNGEAQKIVMRDALAAAAISGADISYVEAHGTGTPVGDPIEAGALGSVLSADQPERSPCVIGSIKSNFGHAESAAGIAGLIKVALMQQNDRIPANLHFETPNPNIPFQDLRLRVPTASEDWPVGQDGRRFAGVNSFGFGGTNAHVIVGRVPKRAVSKDGAGEARGTSVFCLSARSKDALAQSAVNLAGFLRSTEAETLDLNEISAALALGRAHLNERLLVAAHSREEAANLLTAFSEGYRGQGVVAETMAAQGQLAFVCSGMGQQWWGMGRGLVACEPVFAAKVAEIDTLFSKLADDCALADLFAMDERVSPINQTQFAQRAIFAVQVGLAALWESLGIRPDFVVGHSVGEVAASHIAGALSLEDAVTTCFHRSRLQSRLAGRGGMLAVGLSEEGVYPYLKSIEGVVSLAAVNSPGSVTLAGDTDELQRLCDLFDVQQVFARLLNVELPYHAPVMDEIGPELRAELRGISPKKTEIPLVSTVTGALIDGATLDADYWVRNIREPVSFRKAMQALVAGGCSTFVELGAHPVLGTSINECLAANGVNGTAIASQRRMQDDAIAFWSAFGQLYCRGHVMPFERLFRRTGRRVGLPNYPWQKTQYWVESAESHRNRTGRETDEAPKSHPLLGDRQTAPHPAWRSEIGPGRPAFLNDHRVQGSVVFPAAAYVEVVLAACREEAGSSRPIVLEGFKIESPLVLSESKPTQMQMTLGDGGRFEIHSQTGKPGEQHWMRHVTGVAVGASDQKTPMKVDWNELRARLPLTEGGRAFYHRFDRSGLDYGPRFQNIDTVWIGKEEALGRFVDLSSFEDELADYLIHPALLDSAFQLLAGLPAEGTYLPVHIDRMTVFRPGEPVAWAYVKLTERTKSRIKADILVANGSGDVIGSVQGFACQLFENMDRAVSAAEDNFLYVDTWVAEPLHASEDDGVTKANTPDFNSILGRLQARHNDRDTEKAHYRNVHEVMPKLDALALEYFAEALVELGWLWEVGQHITVRELTSALGITPRYQSYVARMLGMLERSGTLCGEQDGWRVLKTPANGSAAKHWRDLVRDYPYCHAELVLVQRCGAGLTRFLIGEDEPLFTLFPKDCPIAEQLYCDGPTIKPYNRIVADLVREIVAQLPEGGKLRILELGAGTGGLTAHILPVLPPERTEYTFTDVSERFLGQARQRFRNHAFMRFEKLDIETDPAEQGFAAGSFDLILAADVLHATSDLLQTLTNTRNLLKPGGALALVELTATPVWFDLVFGLLPGWWAFADKERRPDHATLPVSGWLNTFVQSGFDAGSAIVDEFDGSAGTHSVLLARKPIVPGAVERIVRPIKDKAEQATSHRPVVVMGDDADLLETFSAHVRFFGGQVQTVLTGRGGLQEALLSTQTSADAASETTAPIIVDLRNLRQSDVADPGKAPSEKATLMCADLQGNLLALAGLTQKGRPTLWVVTNGVEAIGDKAAAPNLAGAAVRGFARSVLNEHGDVDTRLADLSLTPDSDELAGLAQEILSDSREPEIALRKTSRYVSRVHYWQKLRSTEHPETNYELRKSSRPAPEDLAFHEASVPAPGPGEVQLKIKASGVNFKDFALFSGLVSAEAGEIGLEASGTVVAVGSGVVDFVPGDQVFGFVQHGMNAVVNVRADVLAHKPDNLTFEDAAGIPVIFLSAYHALKRQAGLREGQTVLIHTGASGLGLAAIAVARALGAKVLATAGTPEKRAYLTALGIEYVGDSRSANFASEVMKHTGGSGVDVVLNTLSAALNAHNFGVLAPGTGRLVDVANVHYDAQIAYSVFARGLSVSAFDLTIVALANPGYIHALLDELTELFASGLLRPIPYRSVSIERLSEVLHSVRKAAHIGKLVISHRDSWLHVVPKTRKVQLAEEASYLVTGGLTGFGLATAKWLADCGARHLVLIGRRGAATPDAAPILAELKATGIDVHAIACDVTNRTELAALIDRFGSDLPPLRGVVHGAMVLRDCPLRNMSLDDIRSVLAPKMDGAWYLHQLTAGQPIEFFICYSSISSLVGNHDQANYAGANKYLEALMSYRRANGKPGLAIGWGMIRETGAVARDRDIMDNFLRQGIYPLLLEKAWASLALGLRDKLVYLGSIVADWRKLGKFARVVASTPRFMLLASGPEASAAAGAEEALSRAPGSGDLATAGSPEDVEKIIVKDIAGILGMKPEAVNVNKPLPELGFDSLMAVELSVALEHSTGHGFNRMSLLRQDLTAAELISVIQEEMSGGKAAEDAEIAVSNAPALAEDVSVADLSDAEVDSLLRQLSAGE
jgi:acyl transferase domain-containing protein/NADPH:quinone reductase-like Zn-dependent oxidoreductase/NAD(P)-dependent dehydrogenase (short-subunit alcohol dehydrogenase family)/acyl carrier protein